jgi:hypothetical protein
MREIRPSGSEGGARFYPLSLPLSARSEPRRGLRRFQAIRIDKAVCGTGAVFGCARFPSAGRSHLEWLERGEAGRGGGASAASPHHGKLARQASVDLPSCQKQTPARPVRSRPGRLTGEAPAGSAIGHRHVNRS